MKKLPLGRLERVDLRTAWKHEATDFTPWLAREENIALLSEVLGLPEDALEVQGQEQAVGPFRADILCQNTEDNSLVLVENQLARTDHSHLGQLITYAAGLNAVTLVWIAERFTEEHRAALDWLNDITDENLHAFGLEIELWRIGDSPPAPKFNVAVQPNEWVKQIRETRAASRTTDLGRLKIEFWEGFAGFMAARQARFRSPKLNRPRNWHGWGLGRSGFTLCAAVNVRDGRNGVWVNMRGPDAGTYSQLLREQRADLEAAVGFPLSWESGGQVRKIIVRRPGDTTDPARWPTQYAWLLDTMTTFDRVFRPRIKALDASTWTGEDDP